MVFSESEVQSLIDSIGDAIAGLTSASGATFEIPPFGRAIQLAILGKLKEERLALPSRESGNSVRSSWTAALRGVIPRRGGF